VGWAAFFEKLLKEEVTFARFDMTLHCVEPAFTRTDDAVLKRLVDEASGKLDANPGLIVFPYGGTDHCYGGWYWVEEITVRRFLKGNDQVLYERFMQKITQGNTKEH
jgi:hypothetical protein